MEHDEFPYPEHPSMEQDKSSYPNHPYMEQDRRFDAPFIPDFYEQ